MTISSSAKHAESQPATGGTSFYSALEEVLDHPPASKQPATRQDQGAGPQTCRFTVVIPALNEEQAIGGTLQDMLQARGRILSETPVTDVHVVVVDDGSSDRTSQIAQGFKEVSTLKFERNRGYGAAIKAGFRADRSELVGFMDADGTLQAECWVALINRLFEEDADVVLGARLNPASDMPAVRRLGNWGFARLLGFISEQPLTDCASGMRVIKRRSLKYLMPLPDGLHFTPAMSCNALMDKRLKIAEVPIPYAERVGKSKLSVLGDGIRFLTTILLTGCFYNPLKCAATGVLFSWLAAAIAWLAGWDAELLFKTTIAVNVMALGAALVCHQAVKALIVEHQPRSTAERWLHRVTRPRLLANIGFGFVGTSALLTICVLLDGPKAVAALDGPTLYLCFIGVALVLLGISLRMMQGIRFKFDALINDPFSRKK